jgi:hypothetical protein
MNTANLTQADSRSFSHGLIVVVSRPIEMGTSRKHGSYKHDDKKATRRRGEGVSFEGLELGFPHQSSRSASLGRSV